VSDLPTLDVLIPSVYARHAQLVALLDHLAPQLEPFDGRARVILARDDGEAAVGSKRNQLLLAATAEYVCQVDDDDWVHDDYVGRIMEALIERPDYVGWKLAYTVDGLPQKPAIHSLTNSGWGETDDLYLRTISHLNPMRRELALLGLPFQPGFGEDKAWADRVAATGRVKTEVYIGGAAQYVYRYSTSGSLFAGGPRHLGSVPELPEYANVRAVI
jgi:glycosyltransferase involved in cell wall biosynthesis